MTFGSILVVAAEVLGCAVALYLLAAFLVSLRRLLPFLAIGSAVATIFVVRFVNNHIAETGTFTDVLFLPIAMSLLTQLFFQADGFMNPNVLENVYRLVSVERKWESVFAEDDEYVLHFSPVEVGGFAENVVFQGILFFLFYYFVVFAYPNSTWGYVYPTFIIAMSIVDVLAVFGIVLPDFIYRIVAGVVLVIAVVFVGLIGTLKNKTYGWSFDLSSSLCEQCAELAVIDDSRTYTVSMEQYNPETKEIEVSYFYIYDPELDVAATYHYVLGPTGNVRQYETVIATSAFFNGERVIFSNVGEDEIEFVFDDLANPDESALFKYTYFTPYNNMDLSECIRFTEEKFYNSGSRGGTKGEDIYVKYESSDYVYAVSGYTVSFYFNTTEKDYKTPVSLEKIKCEFNGHGKTQTVIYYPYSGEESGLDELYNPDTMEVINYSHDMTNLLTNLANGKSIQKYLFENELSETFTDFLPDAFYQSGFAEIANGEYDFAGTTDFTFITPDHSGIYIYDAQTDIMVGTTWEDIENSYISYENAKLNDPDYDKSPFYDLVVWFCMSAVDDGYVSWEYKDGYIKYNYAEAKYTGNTEDANNISKAFLGFYAIDYVTIDKDNLEIKFGVMANRNGIDSSYYYSEYTFRYRKVGDDYVAYEYELKYWLKNFPDSYYLLTLYTNDTYDLSDCCYNLS